MSCLIMCFKLWNEYISCLINVITFASLRLQYIFPTHKKKKKKKNLDKIILK
jgi:hypothetical protein